MEEGARPPAAEHFMGHGPLQRFVRRPVPNMEPLLHERFAALGSSVAATLRLKPHDMHFDRLDGTGIQLEHRGHLRQKDV